jgi:hypothetical protein
MDEFIEKLPAPQPAAADVVEKYLELKSRRDRATHMDR